MTWEEYENSDWYREAHPERFERRKREDLIAEIAYDFSSDLEWYKSEQQAQDEAEIENGKIVHYVTTQIFNGRVRGLLAGGSYVVCRMAKLEYDKTCINSEWDWASVERIVAENEDELEDILIGYRECEYEDYDYDY